MTAHHIECETATCVVCSSRSYEIEAEGYDYLYRTSPQKFRFVRCRDCGHIYLNPRPGAASLPLIYPPNYYTRAGRHAGILLGTVKKFIVRRRLSFFRPVFEKKAAVLEIGCGDGALLMDIKTRYPRLTVSGIDLDMSETVTAGFRAAGIGLFSGDVETMTLPEAAYDLVIMNQMVEHLRHPDQTLGNIARALKPGGLISIETPDINGYDRRIFKKSFWGGYYFPRHMHLFSAGGMERLLAANQLQMVRQFSLVAPIIWIFSLKAACGRIFPVLRKPESLPARLFSDGNPLLLAIFTAIDGLVRFCGGTTSNQKIVARKKTDGPESPPF